MVCAWMGDRLRAGKLQVSQYVTSCPGQLCLAIPPCIGAMSTSLGWKGNCRSGVALAVRHRHSGLSTYGLNGLCQADEHPASAPLRYVPPLPLPFTLQKLTVFDTTCVKSDSKPYLVCQPTRANQLLWNLAKINNVITDRSKSFQKLQIYRTFTMSKC